MLPLSQTFNRCNVLFKYGLVISMFIYILYLLMVICFTCIHSFISNLINVFEFCYIVLYFLPHTLIRRGLINVSYPLCLCYINMGLNGERLSAGCSSNSYNI